LLKPSKAYRPVSLLCPSIKILERLLLPILNEHVKEAPFQHGFRPKHSTVSALMDLNMAISNGINQRRPPQRTILLQLDLSKAFDMVKHEELLNLLKNTTLPRSLVRWFTSYLHGRSSRVMFRDCLSKSRNIRLGVPQGAVTSPKLFNLYITEIPLPPEDIQIVTYADDISIYSGVACLSQSCANASMTMRLKSLSFFVKEV
jgi:retron-type reverse transcriptase